METTLSPADQPRTDRHGFLRLVGTGVGSILLMGCAGATNPDPAVAANQANPARTIDFNLNLNHRANESLKTKGGYVVVNDVVVARPKDRLYIAVSAKCTHEGTLLVCKSVENQFYCPLDLSRFDAKGRVAVGPATQGLQQYLIVADPTTGILRVSN